MLITNPDGSPIPDYLTQSRRQKTITPVQTSTIMRIGANKFFVYSGVVSGDVSAPSTISLINISDVGGDSIVRIQPFFAVPISTGGGNGLGIVVKINDIEVIKSQDYEEKYRGKNNLDYKLFVPRETKLEILSLNTSANNSQERGVNLLGEYI